MSKQYTEMTIGKRIKYLREKNKETQKDLAEAINLSQDAVSKIENGRVELTIQNQLLIAEHYGVSHDFICTGVGEQNILDILMQYLKLEYKEEKCGAESIKVPVLSINKVLYEYLLDMARIDYPYNQRMPAEIMTQWKQTIKEKSLKSIKKGGREQVTVVPVPQSLVHFDDEKEEWKHSDFLRAVDRLASDNF